MKDIVFILGPTAAGKSEVAFHLAKNTGAEIVSCDSMLVYKEPEIITARPSADMLASVPHHFVNIIPVTENYDVYSYYKKAADLITRLYKEGTPVIVCGGTGLYAKALLDGIFEGVSADEELRARLCRQAEQEGIEELYQHLYEVDAEAAEKIAPTDLKRIIRALEVYEVTGRPISELQKETSGLWGELPVKLYALHVERDVLYDRINTRVEDMCARGAVEEVRRLLDLPLSRTAQQIIGIKELGACIRGKAGLDEAKELMKQNTRHYAKRQLTWFRAEKRLKWIEAADRGAGEIAEEIEKPACGGKDKG